MELVSLFKQVLPDSLIMSGNDILSDYSTDESGIKYSKPLIVLFPENTEQVSKIMKTAYDNDLPIIPRGLGTGLSGGAIPIKPSVILCLEKMKSIIEIDEENLMAVVQPGIITGDLQITVEKKGLFYPPDPASLESCSIGGNIAESAGGPRAVKYGTTRDYVRGIEIVSPQGNIMRFGGKIKKDATGYNIKDLIIGSEGTLCVITEITLSLLPLPKFDTDLLIPFNNMEDAARTVSDIIKSRIIPSTIEFMEERALEAAYNLLGNSMPVKDGKAQLLIKIDGNTIDSIDKDAEQIGKICFKNNAINVFVADSKPFKENLWKARRSLHDAVVDMSIEMEREDIVVPPSRLPELISKIKAIEKQYGVMIVIFGHAGDGNVHINIMKTEDNKNEYEKNLSSIVREIMETAVSLGGKLSGEHGIGLFKREFMHLVFTDEQLELMKNIKKAFDPKNLLNPGKIFP